MPKKKTAHTASRLAKKLDRLDKEFLSKPIPVTVHPFGDDSLSKRIRIFLEADLLQIIDSPRGDTSTMWDLPRLANSPWHTLDFEEMILLNAMLAWVASNISFDISWQRRELTRKFNCKTFLQSLEYYSGCIGLDRKVIAVSALAMENEARRQWYFMFPTDIGWHIGSIVSSAMLFWKEQTELYGPRWRWSNDFVRFLTDLIRLIIYRPKRIDVHGKEWVGTYEYLFDESMDERFQKYFPKSRIIMTPESGFIAKPVHWSVSIIALRKLLENRKLCKVSLIIGTRPMADFVESMKNYCKTRGIDFSRKFLPYDVVETSMEWDSIFLIEEVLFTELGRYSCFPRSTVLPITGIKASARYF